MEIAKPGSSERLQIFWEKSFREAYHDIHAPIDIQTYCARNFTKESADKILSDENCICSFAVKSDETVGLSILCQNSCPERLHLSAMELKHLYLQASEYGTGLGRMMMEDAITKTKDSGKSHLWLCVSNLNFRAFRFYQKFGFTKVGNGPMLEVGMDRLLSSIMIREV